MCCRYVLLQEHAKSFLETLGALLSAGTQLPPTRYNIPPGGRIPVIRNQVERVDPKALSETSALEFTSLHWGLTPSWARSADSPVVNARAESLAEKPTFRDAYRFRRCLIPASGFYEWKISGRSREPWLFRLRDERPFAFAALWDTWRTPDGTAHESCALITTAPNSVMSPVHHRMPAILTTPATCAAWLDPRITSTDTLTPLLAPLPAEAMTALAVTPHFNSLAHDDPACLAHATIQQLDFIL
ncbi:MAG: SOS response-associated peptidase [Opitutaceae bacterium]|nr:SOS response-associated peptidase [Opitutaceae bacterium]